MNPDIPQPPQPQPSFGQPGGAARKSSGSLPTLILGISSVLSLPTVFLCCPIIPLPFAILAIFLGLQSKREIAADPSLGGAQETQIGFVMGIVSLVLSILLIVALIAFFGFAILSTES